jgi:hypothetical protein
LSNTPRLPEGREVQPSTVFIFGERERERERDYTAFLYSDISYKKLVQQPRKEVQPSSQPFLFLERERERER